MADTPISGLANQASLTDTDAFAVVDDIGGTPITNRVAASVIRAYVAAGFTASGDVDLSDNEIQQALMTDFGIRHTIAISSSGVLTLDMSASNSFTVNLTENITNINITNAPANGVYGSCRVRFVQDASTARTITYGSEFLFPSGTHHVMTTTLSSVDRVYFETIDGGSTFDCTFAQAFS